MIKKSIARTKAKNLLMNISQQDRLSRSKYLVSEIRKDERFINAETIGIYYPMKYEANLLKLTNSNKQFLFPRVNRRKRLDFVLVNKDTKWKKNKFGINEPINGKIINEGIDLLIIPALAKNRKYRLGYGGGFYDKFLAKHKVGSKIGITLTNKELDFEINHWDIALDSFISYREDLNDS